MTKPAAGETIFMLSEKNEQERYEIERLSKSQWMSDYAIDIFKTMKEAEMRRRPVVFMCTQLDQRPKLLHLCQLITRTYQLSRCCLHLAIYYLDRFIDCYTIRVDKLQLVALTCLHIAAQIENQDVHVPRYSEMNSFVKNKYTAFEFKAVERKVLTFFEFNLIRPTTASFVEMFACSFLTREDYASYCQRLSEMPWLETTYQSYNCFEQMLAAQAQLLLQIADYTLNINRLCNEPPSLLAASCIAATRQLCGLPKRWTPYLTQLTSYSELMVEPCSQIIIIYHYHQSTYLQSMHQLSESNLSSLDSGFEERLFTPQTKVIPVEVEASTIEVPAPSTSQKLKSAKRSQVEIYEDHKTKHPRIKLPEA